MQAALPGLFVDMDIVEIACGTGYWTQYIASKARSIYASDINREMLDFAATKSYHPCQVSFMEMDVFNLPDPPRLFEGLFGGFIWSHLHKATLPALLTQWKEWIEPGSPMVFLDNRYVPGSSTPISRTDDLGNTYQMRTLDSGERFEVMKNFPAEDEMRNQLEPIGWSVEWRAWEYYWMVVLR
ncbi:MAG: class I SAM-dependent methyltransferase, partial [Bacteroidota bacterium]